MTQNILFKDILIDDNTFDAPFRMNWLEENNIKDRVQDVIYNHKIQSNSDPLVASTTDHQINDDARAVNNMGEIFTNRKDDSIVGISNATASAESTANSEIKLVNDELPLAQAISEANAEGSALAVGIANESEIITNRGHDTILGVANASATGSAIAISDAKLVFSNIPAAAISNSVGEVNAMVEAIGISNEGLIATGRGHDIIVGVAIGSTISEAIAKSNAKSLFDDDSSATANSNSSVAANTQAIGINNLDKIITGRGDDIIIGATIGSTISEADAKAFAHNTADLANEHDNSAINIIDKALSNSISNANSISQATTLGIINTGEIFTNRGEDIIIGLAYNKTSSSAKTISKATSTADNIAIANADARSVAISESNTVGIANPGKINTGKNNDTVIGIAITTTDANADANADAVANADNPETNTDSETIADAENVLSIGIDNDISGLLIAGNGSDQVIGIGDIGISGGRIQGNGGSDRIIGYGATVGVANTNIKLGNGNDFFQADIVDINPFTGEISLASDRSGSIKDAAIIGGRGNDTFEIGGFESNVFIDGGKHHDVLKLWGNLDDYKITPGSSQNKTLFIEDADSILEVKNVEAFYFGDRDRAYHYDDFV